MSGGKETAGTVPPEAGLARLAEELRPSLAELHARGLSAHADLGLPSDAFSGHVLGVTLRRFTRSALNATRERLAAAIQGLAAADLFLACACDSGIPAAWERFHQSFVSRLTGLAIKHGARHAEARVAATDLCGDMAVAPADAAARTRIGTYEGTGSLFGWLAIILIRRLREPARSPPGAADTPLRTGSPCADPADIFLDTETAAEIRRALLAIWDMMTGKEALAVLYRYRMGLDQGRIAELLGVGPPRISRILQSATEKIRTALDSVSLDGRRPGSPPGPRLWRILTDAVAATLAEKLIANPHPFSKAPRDGRTEP